MQATRVGQLEHNKVDSQASTEVARRRVSLHERSAFDERKSHNDLSSLDPNKKAAQDAAVIEILSKKPRFTEMRLPNGTLLQVPLLSEADEAAVQRVFARVSPEKRAALEKQYRRFAQEIFAEVNAFPNGRPGGPGAAVTTAAGLSLDTMMVTTAAQHNTDTMDDHMFMGLHGIETDLYNFADGLRDKQLVVEDVKTDLGVLGEMLADWPDDGSKQSFTYTEVTIGEDGKFSVQEKTVELTKEEAMALKDKLSLQTESMDTITGMDAFMVERMTNQYNQAVTTLSNIIKNQDESLRGVAQNVKA